MSCSSALLGGKKNDSFCYYTEMPMLICYSLWIFWRTCSSDDVSVMKRQENVWYFANDTLANFLILEIVVKISKWGRKISNFFRFITTGIIALRTTSLKSLGGVGGPPLKIYLFCRLSSSTFVSRNVCALERCRLVKWRNRDYVV